MPVFVQKKYTTLFVVRRDGGQSCNVIWLLGDSEGDIVNGQTTFTFYIFIFGFLGPLGFILIFYVLVIPWHLNSVLYLDFISKVIIKLRSVGPRGQERSQSKRKSHRKVGCVLVK